MQKKKKKTKFLRELSLLNLLSNSRAGGWGTKKPDVQNNENNGF